jgi:3D (Asp-Asp-Asp) domain-containing protein
LVVKVGDLLQAANSAIFMGSVKIETDSEAQMNMSVLGQVSISGTARGLPVYFEEEFPMAGPKDTGVFRATAPAVLGVPMLALRSTSTSYQTVTESCYYEHGGASQSALKLAPGAVVLSGACGVGSASSEQLMSLDGGWNQTTLDNKSAAGIEVTSTGGAEALCVYGFAISGQPSGPVYASLNFTDAGGINSGNTVFAGVPVGQAGPLGSDNFTPALALTNFGTAQVKATVTLAVTGDKGPNGKKLATVTVPGQSSVTVPLGSLSGDPQLRNSVMVQSDAAKGALYASMVVFGGTTVPTVQLLGRDSMQPYNGGAHPWTTGAGATSTLVMFNYASTPQPFYVAISAGTALWQQRYQLAALETKTLDIGSLVATQTKDENGNVLPANAAAGVAHWFTPNVGQGSGRLLLSQPTTGLARNFGCQTSTALCGQSSLSNSSVTIAAGGSGQMGPYQASLCMTQIGQCSGTYGWMIGWGADWTSSNPSVASFVSASNLAEVTINGNTAGSAQITAVSEPMTQWNPYSDSYWTCWAPTQYGNATVYDPSPSISSVSPNSYIVGQTTTGVQIAGQNFGTNQPQVTLSLGGTVTVTSHSNTLIVVSVTPSTAGTGTFTVTAEGFGGQQFSSNGPGDLPMATSPQVSATALTVSIARQSLTALTATGAPPGGEFGYSADPGDVENSPGSTAQTNPNQAVLLNPANSGPGGAPIPGALSTISAFYDVGSSSVSSTFHVATFGMSCYYTAGQQDSGNAPNSCASVTIYGASYSGYTVNPSGMPAGSYCNAFLAQVTLQGSGQLSNGTDVMYVSGGYPPNGTYQVITSIKGADGTAVVAGQTVARDRSIIPTGGVRLDVNGIGDGLLANDTGGAIVGYRLDYYNGAGVSACSGFSNIEAVSGCNPQNSNCPADTAIQ